MLARTPTTLVYLSAAELGITEREHTGLIEVRDDLASGRVRHVEARGRFPSEDVWEAQSPYFNMIDFSSTPVSGCGTAHCIAGFMRARGVWKSVSQGSNALERLFIPFGGLSHRTPAQAVRAIDEFLGGAGSECWPNAMAVD